MSEINMLIPQGQLEGLPRRGRKKQETRWRIFKAAIELMTKHGYDDVKIEDICAAADVSNPSFFQHFSNKSALMRAYLDELQFQIKAKLEEASEASSEEKLRIISEEISSPIQEGAAFIVQLFSQFAGGTGKLNWDKVEFGLTGIITDIIREGQDSGEFNPQWHPEVLAVSLCASWLVLPVAKMDPVFPDEPQVELLELMLNSLKMN